MGEPFLLVPCQEVITVLMNKLLLLTWILRLHALVLLMAAVPVLLPFSIMDSIHQMLGLGELPPAPLTGYLTRSLSTVYAMHGAVCLALTFDLRRYGDLVRLLALFHVVLGGVLLGIDLAEGMPWFWTLCEGPPIVLFALFIYVFSGHCLKGESDGN